jgi:crossover junction endodeoxyribonuclease RuvC
MRILGIDPGSSVTGYGVVERADGAIRHIAHGTIRTSAGSPLEVRLATIHTGVRAAVAEHSPSHAIVERVFVGTNVRSALVLGQARGAVLAALGEAAIPVEELAPRELKQAITGMGGADKHQVRAMVVRLLALEVSPPLDASDALAMAMCRAQMGRLAGLGVKPRRSSRSRRLRTAPAGAERPQ